MIKKNIRYCDRCKKEIPTVLDLTQKDIIPRDILSLGYKTKTGRTIKDSYDVCQDCMSLIYELLQSE